ncbi:hypothetical protein [Nannocystis bainbridge]|uniref:Uncharacterized protein n=1 Tax=Nannocystis bainbridge TaxID=2995303 RepID=A0ABT5EA99_9BACT|nr:hypothetical protein [Nannocystis bainbridge]MDC0722787.1 hypothetical protein [Nannocystis bainbridge]
MSQEQEDIQRLVRQARRAPADPDALARVWQRLQAPPPAGPDDGGVEVPDPSALADATEALVGKAAVAAGLKTIAAAAVIGAVVVGGRWLTRPEPAVLATPVTPIEAPREPAPIAPSTPPPALAVSPPPEPQPTRPTPRRTSAAPPEDAPDPAAERRLLEAAQAALQRDAPAAALTRLDEHALRFAHGQLADEREVLRVLALCADGRPDAAEATAQTLLRTSGPGLFLPRLRSSCVGERLAPLLRPKPAGE